MYTTSYKSASDMYYEHQQIDMTYLNIGYNRIMILE